MKFNLEIEIEPGYIEGFYVGVGGYNAGHVSFVKEKNVKHLVNKLFNDMLARELAKGNFTEGFDGE